jgi:hypothetical protein
MEQSFLAVVHQLTNLECIGSLRVGVEELGAPSMEGGVVMENDIGSDGVAVPGLDWSES